MLHTVPINNHVETVSVEARTFTGNPAKYRADIKHFCNRFVCLTVGIVRETKRILVVQRRTDIDAEFDLIQTGQTLAVRCDEQLESLDIIHVHVGNNIATCLALQIVGTDERHMLVLQTETIH